jgi:hypothetical protein
MLLCLCGEVVSHLTKPVDLRRWLAQVISEAEESVVPLSILA